MDIFSFINSNAISNYLKQIKYNFNSLETAWLIYQCKRLSYEEKKLYWQKLINTMPDCEIFPIGDKRKSRNSLHSFLKRYIEIYNKIISDFFEENNNKTYVYKYSYEDDCKYNKKGWFKVDYLYPSLKSCLEAIKDDLLNFDDTTRYRIKRYSIANSKHVREIECFKNGQVIELFTDSDDPMSDEEKEIIYDTFDGLWFYFPTPFKKGDILWVPKKNSNMLRFCDGGFVLDKLITWNSEYSLNNAQHDSSDMTAYGFFVDNNGTIYRECMHAYMDLEYYEEPYKENEKILSVLSSFLKDEMTIDRLMNIYLKDWLYINNKKIYNTLF